MSAAPRRNRGSVVLVGLAVALVPASAVALDPSIPVRLTAAPPASVTAAERITAEGTNRTSATFPKEPEVGWQTRLAPPLVGELATDESGRLLVAHAGDRLTALDARGRVAFSLRTGGELASGPLPLAGGRVLVVTRDGRVVRVSPNGTNEGEELLGWGELEAAVVATPTHDGGAIIASGAHLARLGPRGTRGFRARLGDPVRAVFEWGSETLAVGRSGNVFARAGWGEARPFGSFEEPLRAVALADHRLFGVGRHALVELDLVSRERRVLFADEANELRDFAALPSGKWRLVAPRATFIDLDVTGRELARWPQPGGENREISALVADREGRTLFSAVGSPLGYVTPQGDSGIVPGTGCPDPLRPTPLGDGLVVAACRSGIVRALSDKAR
ncbi:MAG TPA: PQQ-binding-like beta-propeller repeat protein [Polyangiaceae bacterium]|nr:PQQ-binding-like beta-propeller repeat protein [Polyangiaceae bacterium]